MALKFFVTGEKLGNRKDGVSGDLLILLLTGYCCLVSLTTARRAPRGGRREVDTVRVCTENIRSFWPER